ncbi:ATP-binding protein [Schinkia azotoformans]|uniref:ATP-binding protein n=1 Tax=Schinkia azotoformans TaxID=1454 RepID=UPI002E200DE7|nr:ATP-binding protein [Schinkia azotoformans]MED4354373.1 ATP-binding protein [Schinkia azotoformans]
MTFLIIKVKGMLPAIISAKRLGIKRLFIPHDCFFSIQNLDGIELIYVEHLKDVIDYLSGQPELPLLPRETPTLLNSTFFEGKDFQYIIGHHHAKRALEIAAAGCHNVFMSGPSGCGKSLLAESFSSILPSLLPEFQLENMSLYELANSQAPTYNRPPFRNPHHSASAVSIIGGGSSPKPGEVSLANHGTLFLDEMAEFPKRTLDMLRQPLETGQVTIGQANGTVTYPAKFILVAAMNPCPCGYNGSKTYYCTCSPKNIQAYQNRISGPIEDRIDILLNLQSVKLNPEQQEQNETS